MRFAVGSSINQCPAFALTLERSLGRYAVSKSPDERPRYRALDGVPDYRFEGIDPPPIHPTDLAARAFAYGIRGNRGGAIVNRTLDWFARVEEGHHALD